MTRPLMVKISTITFAISCAISLSASGILAATSTSGGQPSGRTPQPVRVMVVGCPHLWRSQEMPDPAMVAEVIERLSTFTPDHVAVEWLHPSIDPATTRNYLPFRNRHAIAAGWAQHPLAASGTPATAGTARNRSTDGNASTEARAASHLELARGFFLAGDRLNAGYQGWLADRLGLHDAEMAHLTRDFFAGHEIAVFAFPVAERRGLAYLTPFDYQGPDADWRGSMLQLFQHVRAIAISQVFGAHEGDSNWDDLVLGYNLTWSNLYRSGDPLWRQTYGQVPEAVAYAKVFVDFRNTVDERIAHGASAYRFGRLGYFQTAEYQALERSSYLERMTGMGIEGFGKALVSDWLVRNTRMIDLLERDIERLGSQRVLVLVGSGHKPFFEALLRERGMRVVPSARLLADPRSLRPR